MNLSYWPFMIYLPIWFHAGLGYDSVSAGLALLAYTLPTLVMPPFAERLALRYQPGLIIPAGLFTIGTGFMLMKFGSAAAQPDWLTMLPGCLLAGIGLGITNTPVTNTTTGSVSSDRAGMASGIDMSARMVSLSVNIALMGFILASGVLAHLKAVLPALDGGQLRVIAERIASGDAASAPGALRSGGASGTRKRLWLGDALRRHRCVDHGRDQLRDLQRAAGPAGRRFNAPSDETSPRPPRRTCKCARGGQAELIGHFTRVSSGLFFSTT